MFKLTILFALSAVSAFCAGVTVIETYGVYTPQGTWLGMFLFLGGSMVSVGGFFTTIVLMVEKSDRFETLCGG